MNRWIPTFFFYHTYWDVVGIKVWEMIVHSFHSSTINPALVETLIVPIPKVDNPMSLKDFRPIGLCNVILKAISKILVIRIRPYLKFLIGPLQSSFILGRGTDDNALIAQEIVHSMHKKKVEFV